MLFKPDIEKLKLNQNIGGLIKALSYKDNLVRNSAAEVLGKLKERKAVEPLIQLLKDEDPSVRTYSVIALGNIEDERAFVPLLKILNDENDRVRSCVPQALRSTGGEKSFEYLRQLLNDKNQDVRYSAVRAIASPETIDDLINVLLNDNDDWFIVEAVLGLERQVTMRLGHSDIPELVNKIVPPLINALDGKRDLVKISIMKTLGKMGDPRALNRLAKEFENGYYDENSDITRNPAIVAIDQFDIIFEHLDDNEKIDACLLALENNYCRLFREKALRALGHFCSPANIKKEKALYQELVTRNDTKAQEYIETYLEKIEKGIELVNKSTTDKDERVMKVAIEIRSHIGGSESF